MKKLIAISVVFALVAGAVFAVDVGASVIGTAVVLKGDTSEKADGEASVFSGGSMKHVRIDGSGEAGENFGGYFRVCSDNGIVGNAWWKPIDQFKLLIGGNGGDGFIGKEGVTGWMFYQTVTDTGVAMEGGNVWGWHNGTSNSLYEGPLKYRYAFFEDRDGQDNAYLFITPIDILAINVILPVMNNQYDKGGAETANVFKRAVAQIDLNLDFGNIALTYEGGVGYDKDKGYDDPSAIFLYYGGSFGDISIDFGFGYHMATHVGDDSVAQPIGIGVGLKYATDAFGIKFRTAVSLAGDDEATNIIADVMPYFPLGDNLTVFVSVGLGMLMPKEGDSLMGWHFNPYLQVGEEWGAKFLVGLKVWSQFQEVGPDGKLNDSVIKWAVPVALNVSF